jgi:hypothetical protein
VPHDVRLLQLDDAYALDAAKLIDGVDQAAAGAVR